jgi:hypothetical protein
MTYNAPRKSFKEKQIHKGDPVKKALIVILSLGNLVLLSTTRADACETYDGCCYNPSSCQSVASLSASMLTLESHAPAQAAQSGEAIQCTNTVDGSYILFSFDDSNGDTGELDVTLPDTLRGPYALNAAASSSSTTVYLGIWPGNGEIDITRSGNSSIGVSQVFMPSGYPNQPGVTFTNCFHP